MAEQSWCWLQFVDTLAFTRKLYQIADDRTFQAIQSQLVENPERWPIVAGTGGSPERTCGRSDLSRGKRGSFRYYCLYVPHRGRVYLLAIFSKREASDLSPSQKKEVAKIITRIQKEA